MAGRRRVTRDAILEEAKQIVAAEGTAGLTFQALAERLGVSKQAIIYWYPAKWQLAQDYAVRALGAEADATTEATAGAETAGEAIERFVRALVGHHLRDLGGFRLLYLLPQFDPPLAMDVDRADALGPIHETTAAMYGALEAAIQADAAFRPGANRRRLAVAVHSAAIGLLTMLALAEASDDPLAHGTPDLIDALVALLAGAPEAAQRKSGKGRRPARTVVVPKAR